MPNPCAIVIFGASGDLAKRKLLPALYELALQKLLDEKTYIIGYSRSQMSDDDFRKEAKDAIGKYARTKPVDDGVWSSLEKRLFYIAADYGADDGHAKATAKMNELDKQFGTGGNRLYYISTPPATFEPIITGVGKQITAGRRSGEKPADAAAAGWKRIIIEKPFGTDLASAKALNALLLKNFKEDQVFRIDHYLGKETVQNMMVLRFANSIFEPIWNYKYIDHVQITVSETLGVEKRGGYYDKSGALRDMVQNHLFQLMALVAMEPPAGLDATNVRDEKVKVFRSVRPIDADHLDGQVVRGQYGPGKTGKDDVPGYTQAEGVPADSKTETFVALQAVHRQLAVERDAVLPADGQGVAGEAERDRRAVPQPAADAVPAADRHARAAQRPADPRPARGGHHLAVQRQGARRAHEHRAGRHGHVLQGHVPRRGPRGVRAADRRRDQWRPDAVHPRRRGRGGVDRGRPDRPRLGRRQGGRAAGVRAGLVGPAEGDGPDRGRRPPVGGGRGRAGGQGSGEMTNDEIRMTNE